MKKTIRLFILSCLICSLLISVASATNFTKSESGYGEKGLYTAFWPKSGSLTATYSATNNTATTTLSFTYGEKAIKYFNDVYWPDSMYPGVEIRDYPNSGNGNFSAPNTSVITTNLPNPKLDVENDQFLNSYNEEAEVTALGKTLVADHEYTMSVVWTDYRDGSSAGVWGAKAELSKKGIIDYNVQDYKYLSADVPYGATAGASCISDPKTLEDTSTNATIQTDGLPTTITFGDYLSFDEFSAFSNEFSFSPVLLQLRGVTPEGERITLFAYPNISLNQLQSTVTELAQRDNYTILGITSVHAYADTNQIMQLRSSEHVYQVDAVNSDAVTGRSLEVVDSKSNFAHPLTWQLEDEGVLLCNPTDSK